VGTLTVRYVPRGVRKAHMSERTSHDDDDRGSPAQSGSGEGPDPADLGDDPTATDHPTGDAQAAENAENDQVS
jgi:hypothetical protein